MTGIEKRTRAEKKAGRAAAKRHQEAFDHAQAQAAAGVGLMITDQPVEDTRQEPQKKAPRTTPWPKPEFNDENVVLPDAIRSCIDRADIAYKLAYHPSTLVRFRRWLARRLWR